MNPQAIFDKFECRDPPKLLWRVTDRVSQAHNDAEHCLTTKSQLEPITQREFKEAIENHFDWANRTKASCFQSVFSSKSDARDWGLYRLGSLRRKYTCKEEDLGIVRLEIDCTRLMKSTWIFDAEDVAASLDLEVNPLRGEYLVYLEIPAETIVARSRLCDLRKESINHYSPRTLHEDLLSLLDDRSAAEDTGDDADDELSGERDEDSEGEKREDISHSKRTHFLQLTRHNTLKFCDLSLSDD
ncbi:hypothetical protein BLS_007570 [Venturia inaequalis]|uniref:DUF7587 domain-containing protein n=1 Tax=Venturia inaequalis TaxID=5025 RepID=A0A8H3ZAQ1_VENIN|nr:hypothetical protein BLS_007570 [Venturia inaequalis]KAE9991766.1 hypothetical protein EG327_011043 [Venturia inaequalis]